MKKTVQLVVLLGALWMLTAPSTWAHHSTAMFDTAKVSTYRGVITKIVWANPHCFIYFDGNLESAPPGAPVEHWAVEGQSPSVMFNHGGWDEDTAKVGDKIIISGNPRRDGVPTMLLISAKLNGKTYEVLARQSVSGEKQ